MDDFAAHLMNFVRSLMFGSNTVKKHHKELFIDQVLPKQPDYISKEAESLVTPLVGDKDTYFFIWGKMLSLYFIWGWVSISCELNATLPLVFNDGGKFYNECYYMFYNGVKWYKQPKAWKLS